jgi:hypothetical protein
MANDFLRLYKFKCKALLAPLGFKQKNTFFYRVINDVFQFTNLQRYRDGRTFSITFDALPFCCGIETNLIAICAYGFFNLEDFAPLPDYWGDSPESIQCCVERLEELFQEFVIPFFERAIDTQAVLVELNLYEKMKGIVTPATVSWKVDICIKLGDYAAAIRGLRWLTNNLYRYNTYNKPLINQRITEYYEMIEWLQARDEVRIRSYVEEQECKIRAALGLPLIL